MARPTNTSTMSHEGMYMVIMLMVFNVIGKISVLFKIFTKIPFMCLVTGRPTLPSYYS